MMDVLDIAIQELHDAAERLRAEAALKTAISKEPYLDTVDELRQTNHQLAATRAELLACYEVLERECSAHPADLPTTITPGCVSDSIHATVSSLKEKLAAAREEVKRLADKLEAQRQLNSKELATITRQQEEKDAKDAEIARLQSLHGCASCPVELREQAKDEEIVRLRGELEAANQHVKILDSQLEMTQADNRKEISDLKGAVASLRTSKDQWKSQTRKHGERVRELETGIADRDKTIAGLRRIQDILARQREA